HHSRLRQADRRCRVQPRLRRGAGRRAVHRHRLHRDEPDRRRALYRHQSEAAHRMSAVAVVPVEAEAVGPRRSRVVAKFLRNRSAVAGALIVALFVVLAVFAPLIAPYDPNRTNFSALRQAPSATYWLGTDEIGRDILS